MVNKKLTPFLMGLTKAVARFEMRCKGNSGFYLIAAGKRGFFLIVWAAFMLSDTAWAATAQGPVTVVVDYVIDGDSLMVKRDGKAMEVRLWGIDAPEYDQAGSGQAREALKRLVNGQKGELSIKYLDRYDRYVAVLTIGNFNVNEEMIRAGHSWVYERYCNEPPCQNWIDLQRVARKKGRGLWRETDPVPPWRWKAER